MSSSRDRLIDTAFDLFHRHGFHAVGLDRILVEVGVTKTTFYNHFNSRDDLIIAVIEKREQWESAFWHDQLNQLACDPRGKLLALFDGLHAWFNDPEFRGCIFMNAATVFPNPHDPVHQAASRHSENFHNMILDLARQADLPDPDSFAEQYVILVEGALSLRYVTANLDAALIARRTAELLLNSAQPQPVA